MSGGQANYFRGTGDFNLPLGDSAAARLAIMDQRQRRSSSGTKFTTSAMEWRQRSPSASIHPTRTTLSYYKEVENNLPDYGIPFIDGAAGARGSQ